MRELRSNLRRLGRILRIGGRHLLAAWWERRRWPNPPRRPIGGPERLRLALEEIGGTFIKLGQMLALQPDILPLAYCNALFKLLDRVEPFGYADVERIVVEDLGRRPEEVFDSFDRASFAAASIGQVHHATLGGRRLAVKVQRPTVETDFAGDIRLMTAMVLWIRRLRLAPLHWLVEPLSEFVAWTREELDYRIEARYMDRLRRNSADNPAEHVPEVLWDLTARRVLVLEYLDGMPVLEHVRALERGDELTPRRLAALRFEPNAYARNIIDNFLGDAFRHGIFHADLHPANLMILPDNVVGYLDFGITGVLSMHSRRSLVGLTLAYTRGDLDGMCEAFFRVSTFGRRSSPRRFRRILGRYAETWYEVTGGQRRLKKNFTLVMLDMLRLSRAADVWPERDVIKYIRSAIALDGLIYRFAPSFDVGRYLEEVCARHLQVAGLESSLSSDHLLGWSLANLNLLRDGPLRGAQGVDRLLAGGLTAHARIEPPPGAAMAALRVRALRQSAFVAAAGCVAALPLGAPEPGLNLFSAALLLLFAGLAALLDTSRRLLRAGADEKEILHA